MDDHGKGPLSRALGQALRAPGSLGVAALVLAVAAPLPGCKKHSGENFGLLETAPAVTATPSGAELTRADLLLQLLSLSHAEVTARLGAHRIESQTQWSITPVVAAGAAAGKKNRGRTGLGEVATAQRGSDICKAMSRIRITECPTLVSGDRDFFYRCAKGVRQVRRPGGVRTGGMNQSDTTSAVLPRPRPCFFITARCALAA